MLYFGNIMREEAGNNDKTLNSGKPTKIKLSLGV